jgi:hypothetical protein
MLIEPLPSLARRRLTDFFEGAGQDGRRETVLALFQGRRLVVGLLWAVCQSVIGLFLFAAGPQASLLDRTLGPFAISMILAAACLGVVSRDLVISRNLHEEGLDRAWRRARDRSVTRLATFSLSLVVGGALALIWSKYAFCGLHGTLH